MASRSLTKSRLGLLRTRGAKKLKGAFYWLRDWIWPMLEPSVRAADTEPGAGWPETVPSTVEALEASYSLLKDELKAEDDRSKVVEAKLQGTLSFVPLAMTVVFAAVTFSVGRKAGEASSRVIIAEVAGAFYIALQILRALLAVINGLSSRDYNYLRVEDLIPKQGEARETYLNRTCKEIFEIIRLNREVTNEKLSQLNLGHAAIRNAVWGLFLAIGAILTFTLLEMYSLRQ